MSLLKFLFLNIIWNCVSEISSHNITCLRNGACADECPRGFSGDSNCNSCTDDRLSLASNCTRCKEDNKTCLMGNFTLSVLFHSYVNPNSLCGECRLPEYGTGPVCCDTFNQTEYCPSDCLFRFVFSIESYGEPLKYVPLPAIPPDFRSDNFSFPEGIDSFHYYNFSNPLIMALTTWTGRFQMHIVVYDTYRVSYPHPLGRFAVDRFAINITLDGLPSTLSRRTYHGVYGVAQFDLSFEIQSDGYYRPQYSTTPQPSILNVTPNGTDNLRINYSEDTAFTDLMNSYRVLLILVIILPIIAILATIFVMVIVFILLLSYCRNSSDQL